MKHVVGPDGPTIGGPARTRCRGSTLRPHGPRVGLRSPKDNCDLRLTLVSLRGSASFLLICRGLFKRRWPEEIILARHFHRCRFRRSKRHEADPRTTRTVVGPANERRIRNGCRLERSPREDRGARRGLVPLQSPRLQGSTGSSTRSVISLSETGRSSRPTRAEHVLRS